MILAIAAADTAMCGRCASGATCCMTAPSTGVGSGSRWDAGGRWVTCFLAPTPPWPVKSPSSERDHDLDEPLAVVADAVERAHGTRGNTLEEPWADTTTPAGRMVLTVFAGVAEHEREMISQRTRAALQVAR